MPQCQAQAGPQQNPPPLQQRVRNGGRGRTPSLIWSSTRTTTATRSARSTFEVRPGTGYAVASPSEATVTVKGPGAICTSTGNLRIADPLTAGFEGFPPSHDGRARSASGSRSARTSRPSAADLRDHALTVSGGTVTSVERVNQQADLWERHGDAVGHGRRVDPARGGPGLQRGGRDLPRRSAGGSPPGSRACSCSRRRRRSRTR